MRSILLILIGLQLLVPEMAGQDWIVPDDKKSRLSTFPFDENTRKAGEKLYTVNCMSCHGTPGKGNFLKLVPPPGDPATEKIQRNNDGEIFYKVTNGRGQMPAFKNVLSTAEIWNIVSFLRTFNNNYKQEIMPVITSSAYPGAVIRILLSYNPADTTIILTASAIKSNSIVPVINAEAKLFVHRTFGQMVIDEPKNTDKSGTAVFRIPHNFPGDIEGNVLLSARFTNEDVFGSVSTDTLLCAGAKIVPVSLVAERGMWNNVKKAPVWIILTYGIGLLTAVGFILLVLMKLRDIYIVGETVSKIDPENEK
jgi:mono/diheme cytochrome c family protein